ncbi:hypothetical protein ABFP38_003443 [Enterobacter hormaechei]
MKKIAHKKPQKKSDYFRNGKPVHRKSFCAFLDVLGFSERTSASYKNSTEDSLLMEFHQILTETLTALKEDTDESMLYFKSFTDNVVLAHPEFSNEMESEFGLILYPIREYQFRMALKGVFSSEEDSPSDSFLWMKIASMVLHYWRHIVWKVKWL